MTLYEEEYWSERYAKGQTHWDLGSVSTPLKDYIDQLNDTSIRILIPGCGSAYEASYLFEKGFKNTTIIDISAAPIVKFTKQNPNFNHNSILQGDFFNLNEKYDLILEQTFFCALHPDKREKYALKMCDLLNDGGKLVGVLFDVDFHADYPPFGGTQAEYEKFFSKYYKLEILEKCYNSILPRMEKELFFKFGKKTSH